MIFERKDTKKRMTVTDPAHIDAFNNSNEWEEVQEETIEPAPEESVEEPAPEESQEVQEEIKTKKGSKKK